MLTVLYCTVLYCTVLYFIMVVLPAPRNPHSRDTGSSSSLASLADAANVWKYEDSK